MSGHREERDIRLELERISEELRQPSQAHPTRHSALNVIESAISDLLSKERELASAISLSKLLLSHNHSLSQDLQSAIQAKMHLETTVCALRQELRQSKLEGIRLESKCKALEASLREEAGKSLCEKQLEEIARYVKGLEREVTGLRENKQTCEACKLHTFPPENLCINSDSEACTDTSSLYHKHESFPSSVLSLSNRDSISVLGRPRLSPGEEYFTLVTQCVKMNTEGGGREVATKTLYQEAIKQGVTFDKWHRWVEEQLRRTSEGA